MTDTTNKQCFLLPMNATDPEYLWCPSLYEYTVLKEYIDSLFYHEFKQNIDTTTIEAVSVPVIAEMKCPIRIHPVLIITLAGILFLILLIFQIICLLQHHLSRITSQQRRNESVQYEEIEQNNQERFDIPMNEIKEGRTQSIRL
ncbi:unnamed protein product [Rotaria sp. Silwood1]|nr:unnamed protein product [Rotaria sp. Silwood1]